MSPIFVALGPAILVAIIGFVAVYITKQKAWQDGWDACLRWSESKHPTGDMGQMEDLGEECNASTKGTVK